MALVHSFKKSLQNLNIWLVTAITIAFTIANVFLLYQQIYLGLLVPAVIVVIFLIIRFPVPTFYGIIFLTPFSVNFTTEMGAALQLPSEPLVILLMGLFILYLVIRHNFNSKILSHPITLIIIFQLFWIFLTTITSSLPLVSLKFFLSRFWLVMVFFFFAAMVFDNFKRIKLLIWLYSAALAVVIIYTIKRHSEEFFSHAFANSASMPFYVDHGVYSAAIALMLPLLYLFVLKGKTFNITGAARFWAFGLAAIFTLGLIISLTRAAWLSVAIAGLAFILFTFRVKLRTIVLALTAICGLLYYFQTDIYIYMTRNKDASDSNISQHLRSAYNITTDVSNLERINRWNSAIRMFQERPVVGWGPGTYQFKYAPFQVAKERTVISTNRGDMGNAHSEYLGPLAESGFFGFLSIVLLMLVAVHRGMQIFYHSPNQSARWLAMGITLGLITYFSHGLLNNYLETDKIASIFWGFLVILVLLDIKFLPAKPGAEELNSQNDVP